MSDRSVSVMTGAAFKLLLVGGGEAETGAAAGGGAGGGDLMTVELSRLGTHLQAALGRHHTRDSEAGARNVIYVL